MLGSLPDDLPWLVPFAAVTTLNKCLKICYYNIYILLNNVLSTIN